MRGLDRAPQGLVGAGERPAIGVHLSIAIKGKTGAPAGGGRFYFTTQTTQAKEFQSGGGSRYSSPARDFHAAFRPWNDAAVALGEKLGINGAGRFGIVRGNLIWADLKHSARWSRTCQKPQGQEKAPPSRRPWCEGNGITARRFSGMDGDEEVYRTLACPNEDCPLAMGKLCKPSAHLVFRLRWNPADPFEAQFPALICEWTSGGWESLAGMRGLFELVLGTEALRTPEEVALATPEERAAWLPGLAHDFGIAEPSLLGLPFAMAVTWRTKPAKAGQAQGTRYPVVSFSFDGDPAEWLMLQHQQIRALSGRSEPLALPSVQDAAFEHVERHDSRVELDPGYIEPGDLVTLSPEDVAALRAEAGAAGVSFGEIEERLAGGPLEEFAGPSVAVLRAKVREMIEALK